MKVREVMRLIEQDGWYLEPIGQLSGTGPKAALSRAHSKMLRVWRGSGCRVSVVECVRDSAVFGDGLEAGRHFCHTGAVSGCAHHPAKTE